MNELNTFDGTFEETFKRLRRVSQITTQGDIARVLGISNAAISHWKKSNNFPSGAIERICEKFKIGCIDYIITGEGEVPPLVNGGIENFDEIPRTFEARLRQARKRFGSMQDLAEATGTTIVTIHKWETKPPEKISTKLLKKIATALEVSERFLLFGFDHPRVDLNNESGAMKMDLQDSMDFINRSPQIDNAELIITRQASRFSLFDSLFMFVDHKFVSLNDAVSAGAISIEMAPVVDGNGTRKNKNPKIYVKGEQRTIQVSTATHDKSGRRLPISFPSKGNKKETITQVDSHINALRNKIEELEQEKEKLLV